MCSGACLTCLTPTKLNTRIEGKKKREKEEAMLSGRPTPPTRLYPRFDHCLFWKQKEGRGKGGEFSCVFHLFLRRPFSLPSIKLYASSTKYHPGGQRKRKKKKTG